MNREDLSRMAAISMVMVALVTLAAAIQLSLMVAP